MATIGFQWQGTVNKQEGTATWTVGDYTQAVDFPSFTHAHCAGRLIDEAFKAGHAMALRQVDAMLGNITKGAIIP